MSRRDQEMTPGAVLDGRYRIDGIIGSGGMGSVYRATQLAVGRPVAVKTLKSADASKTLHDRFELEARTTALLNHPNIVSLVDFGRTPEGALYLVMELLEGETLGSLMRREGPLAPTRVVSLALQALAALAVAHERGVIHRDLKPENFFVTSAGVAGEWLKILDFGIAKLTGAESGGVRLTAKGMTVGSPRSMSPEQAMGANVTPQSDLYSLGCVMYEMLTGQLPFKARAPTAMIHAHLFTPPDPPTVNGRAVTGGLVDLILECLSKQPLERPESAAAMAARLAALGPVPATLEGEAASVVAPRPASPDLYTLERTAAPSAHAPTLPAARSGAASHDLYTLDETAVVSGPTPPVEPD